MLSAPQVLQQYFGHNNFREGQETAIQRVLEGRHTLLVMPTGSGKSLAYQLPAMLLSGLTLVISPLISLMKDQVDSLTEAGIPATYLNSTLPHDEINHRMRAVREGHVKLLYIAPERLRSRHFTRVLAKMDVSLLAVDEAHCISQWGHDFRPDYLQIGPIWQAMGEPTLLATTATATPTVRDDIIKLLGLKEVQAIVTGFNRPNLTFRVKHSPDTRTKFKFLQDTLPQLDGSAIVYAATRRNTEEVADFICDGLGLPAQAYHAGLDRNLRRQTQTDFMTDRLKIVVATNAFGMGIDKAEVRAVIHYNMPATVEAYYQEAGRAGRDGLPAECVLLFSPDDQGLQEWFINNDTPLYPDLGQVYDLLARAATNGEVYFALTEMAELTGLHPVKVRVTLSELEQAGLLIHLGDEGGYGRWKVLPLTEGVLAKQAKAISRRAQIRFDLLHQMVAYARLTTCRRKFLLDYFGDVSPPQSPRCCDNHTTTSIADLPPATTPQEWLPLIVLDTARSFQHRPLGRKRLAQLLSGSQAKGMEQFGYTRHKFYGKLQMLSQAQITVLIDALIEQRYLNLTGGELPVLVPSALGREALQARAALPVDVPALSTGDDAADRWQPRSERSDTVTETFELFQQGLTPAEIAETRALAERTIYNHLARLIADEKIELHQVVPADIETQILQAVEKVDDTSRLTPIKARLPAEITFDQIKCVLAAHPALRRAQPSTKIIPQAENESVSTQGDLPSSPDTIVLDAVVKLNGTLGRTGLSQFLAGSKTKWLETFADHSAYGQLSNLSQKDVLNIIDALVADGKLTTTGGNRPKVVVPNAPLEEEASQPTEIPRLEAATDVESDPSPDPDPDPALLEALRAWRTDQAREQDVPAYVVFSNKILEAIAARQPASLAELGEIAGIGPVKLEQYGEIALRIVSSMAKSEAAADVEAEEAVGPTIESEPQKVPVTVVDESILETVLTVVSDLEGLLTPHGLALLLTAAPDEVAPFSDHRFFASLHGQVAPDVLENHIQRSVRSNHLSLTSHGRLVLVENKNVTSDK